MLDLWFVRHADAVQAALFLTLFGLFALVERRAPARAGVPRARWRANLALTALNVVVQSALPVSFFAAAAWAAEREVGLLHRLPLPPALAAAATLLGRAFVSFSTHWLMHKVPWFWRLHRVHHSDTEMDVSTTVRFHPLEFAVGLPLGLPVIVSLGASPWAIVLYELLDAGINVLSHANVRLPRKLEFALRYLVVTPDLHRVHHSSHQPETDSNFGAVFPVWDLVFGTYRTETRAPQETMELGLAELRDERAHRAGWLLVSPFSAWPPSPVAPRARGAGALQAAATRSSARPCRRPRPPLLFLVALGVQSALALPVPPAPTWPARVPGLMLLGLGLALTVAGEREFRRRGLEVGPDMKLVELVESGPFRRSRNPMYLGLITALLGTALALAAPAALVPTALFALLIDRRVRDEELLLAARFGERYGAYRARVRRWI